MVMWLKNAIKRIGTSGFTDVHKIAMDRVL